MSSKMTTITGAATALVLTGAIGFGGFAIFSGAGSAAAPAEPVATATTIDLADVPFTNGLAAEQEAEAAAALAAEQARIAAEAEAARVAAEQAAAAEAERIAAEQAASFDEPVDDSDPEPPAPTTEWDPNTTPHTICEVLADGTQVPCQ